MRPRKKCPEGACRLWHRQSGWNWTYRTQGKGIVRVWTCTRCGTKWRGEVVLP